MKNKGFSYIEMILVIAIATIMTSFVGITIGLVNRNNVSKAVSKADSVVRNARTITIAKGTDNGTLVISNEGGSVYFTVDGNRTKVATRPVRVAIALDDGTLHEVIDGTTYSIKFKRTTGGLSSANDNIVEIRLYNEKDTARLKISKLTGFTEIL